MNPSGQDASQEAFKLAAQPVSLPSGVAPTQTRSESEKHSRRIKVLESANRHLAAASELVSRLQSSDSPQAACETLAADLADSLGQNDTQVFVGLRHPKRGLELKGSAPTRLHNEVALESTLTSAMREAIAKEQRIEFHRDSTERIGLLSHQRLAQMLSQKIACEAIFTILLRETDGTISGVLLVASNRPLTLPIKTFLEATATPVANSLALLVRCQKPKLLTAFADLREHFAKGRLKWLTLATAALCLLACIPMPYVVHGDCRVDPTQKRFVCAPFSAQLEEALVEPGDLVSVEQTLSLLDGKPTLLELAEVEAQLKQAQSTRDGHAASHEQGKAQIAQLEVESLAARQELLNYQLENLSIESPLDGIVLTGDLKLSQGKPLEMGEVLFEIAPLDELAIEVAVPEDDVRFVDVGDAVKIQLDSFPFQTFRGTVERVYPSAVLEREENVFLARVALEMTPADFRPGMAGNARISTDSRPIGWNWTHKAAAQIARWCGW